LDDFARILLYRERASEFELLAETEACPNVRLRYRRHRAGTDNPAPDADRKEKTGYVAPNRTSKLPKSSAGNSPTASAAKLLTAR
jgi:hypothetical protein